MNRRGTGVAPSSKTAAAHLFRTGPMVPNSLLKYEHNTVGRHQFISQHVRMARVGALPGVFPDGFELPVFPFPD